MTAKETVSQVKLVWKKSAHVLIETIFLDAVFF